MPIRGENIGTAYVRILADGDGFEESVRKQFNDAEPSVREAGEHNADAYSDAFNKQYRKSFKGNFDKTQKDLFEEANQALTQQLARLKLADNFFKAPGWKEFRTRLVNESGTAGDLAGERLEKRFRDSANLDGLADAMKGIGPEIRKAQADLLADMHSDANRMNREFDRARLTQLRNRVAEENRIQKLGLMQTQALEEDRRRTVKGLVSDYGDLVHQLHLVSTGSRDATSSQRDIIQGLRLIRSRAGDANLELVEVSHNFDEMHRRARLLTPTLSRLDAGLVRFSDTTGRAFGRGSRNDFLNFFGSVVRNVLSVTRILPNLIGMVTRTGRTFSDAFTGGGGGINGLLKGFQSMGPVAASAAAGLAAFGIGAAAVAVIIGPLIALMSGLLAIVTALAGSLLFALVGGLVAVAGAIVPLVAGFGVLAGAIASVDGDRLERQFRPLVRTFKDLGEVAAGEIFGNIDRQVNQLERAFSGLTPTVRSIARGLRGAFNGWADDLDSPGFRRWADQMGNVLPRMIRSLGGILSNTLGGIGGFFEAASPLVRDFLNWVERITAQFSNWANSAGGRDQIRDFLRDAAGSAKAVGGFLKEAGGLLNDLFRAGQGTGDSIFDDMADAMRRFRDYLRENPDALQTWFEDGLKLARSLGRAAEAIGKVVDVLDSPENRRGLRAVIDAFTFVTSQVASLEGMVDRIIFLPFRVGWAAIQRVVELIKDIKMPDLGLSARSFNVGNILSMFAGLGPRLVKALGKVNVGDIITGAGRALGNLVAAFIPGGPRILRTIGKVNVSGIIDGAGRALAGLIGTFAGAGVKVLNRIGKTNVSGIITGAGAALAGLLGTFAGAGAKILGRIGKVNVSGIITGASEAASNLVGAFAGLASRIVSAIGTIVPKISLPDIPGVPGFMAGGIVNQPMIAAVGERGMREAVVPLDLPLSQVDPSVRRLAAMARGQALDSLNVQAGPSKVVNVEQTIVTPTSDSLAVAHEVVNQLVAVGY